MKIKNIKWMISSFAFMVALSSCEDPEGACERKTESDIGPGQGKYIYSCRDSETDGTCSSGDVITAAFHEGADCGSLGYEYQFSSGAWFYSDTDQRRPGPNGAFKDDTSGSGSLDCSGGYNGPSFNIQIDSQCQTAYAYACSGSQQGVDAACAIYKTYQDSDPSIPDCPYCS